MPAIFKSTASAEIAKSFYDTLVNRTTQVYYMLGRISGWDNDFVPPNPLSSALYEEETRRDSIRFQQVTAANTTLLTSRLDWAPETVYDMYDTRSNTIELSNARMFILTDDFNIYKCIFNNYGAQSTVKPTGTSVEYITLADGYVWKFMKSLSGLERARYLTNNFIPVSDVVSGGFFNGAVQNLIINDGGTGYDPIQTTITISGDGVEAIIEPIISGGVITNFVLVNAGEGYTFATATITDASGNGSGADIDVEIGGISLGTTQADVQLAAVDGEISSIFITNQGTGYTTANATIVGDGSGGSVTPVIENGSIISFVFAVNGRGSGYTNATIEITGDGSGFAADVIIGPSGGHGSSLVNESFPTAILMFIPDIDTEISTVNTAEASYRQVTLITDPSEYNSPTNTRFNGPQGTSCWLIEDPSILTSNFNFNDLLRLKGDNQIMRVVSVENGKLLVQILNEYVPTINDDFDKVDINNNVTVNDALTSITTITPPTIDRFSGTVIFIDNRAPFKQDVTQIANIRTLLRF